MYSGCPKPLLAENSHAGDYHGKDGLGDVPDPKAPGLELLQQEDAVHAIIRIINENSGEVGQVFGLLIYLSYLNILEIWWYHFKVASPTTSRYSVNRAKYQN